MAQKTDQDIRDAIAALPGGHGTVELEACIYILHETLVIPEGVHVRGQGPWATQLFRARHADCDMIHLGGGDMPYQKYPAISDLRLHGNKAFNEAGAGLIVSHTWHARISSVRIQDVSGWGLKVLRSYWATFQGVHIRNCDNGIQLGRGTDNLYSNSCEFSTFHVEGLGVCSTGIHIDNACGNLLNNCDTSGCEIGVLLETTQGGVCVEKNVFMAHHFESNQTGIVNRQGPFPGPWVNVFIAPRFGNNRTDIKDDVGNLRIVAGHG